jgi:hypothetical protein
VQPKLKISKPNDYYEQEADRLADEVMRMPEPQFQQQVNSEDEEEDETVSGGTNARGYCGGNAVYDGIVPSPDLNPAETLIENPRENFAAHTLGWHAKFLNANFVGEKKRNQDEEFITGTFEKRYRNITGIKIQI